MHFFVGNLINCVSSLILCLRIIIVFILYSVLYFIFKQHCASIITSTATRRKFLARLWTSAVIYYWINYKLLIIIYLYFVRVWIDT